MITVEKEKKMLKPFTVNEGNKIIKPFTMEKEMVRPFTMNLEFAQSANTTGVPANTENKVVDKTICYEKKEDYSQNDCLKYSEVNKQSEKNQSCNEKINAANLITQTITEDMKSERTTCGNFRVYLKSATYYISDTEEGEKVDVSYEFAIIVYLMNGQQKSFHKVVRAKDAKKPDWVLSATGAIATECNTKKLKKWFSEMVQVEIENCNCHKRIYPSSGWRNTEYGRVYVYSEGAIGAEESGICSSNGYSLQIKRSALASYDTYKNAIGMTEICNNKVASTLIFIYFHASLLTTLFSEAGFPINFVMGVIGMTGSRKTSMSTAMAQLFNRNQLKADTEFTSTAGGIEEWLSRYGDSIVIIDDFITGENYSEQMQNSKKLQALVRFYGNRVSKKRMTFYSGDSKKPYFPIRGCCLLTGEQITGIMSSISRMFIVDIDQTDVNNQALEFYQKNTWILSTYAYDFIEWSAQNYDRIVEYINMNFSQKRKELVMKHPRYSEMYATFSITVHIFLWYSQSRNFLIDKNYTDQIRNNMLGVVVHALKRNSDEIVLRDPGSLILLALDEAIRKCEYVVTILTRNSANEKATIYEDENYYYIQRETIGCIFADYVKKYGIDYNVINDRRLISLLAAQDVIDIEIEADGGKKRSRKLPFQNGNYARYLWVNKKKLKKKLEEIKECE